MRKHKIDFEPTLIAVKRFRRRHRVSYRWVPGFYVVIDGNRLYPPMQIREARRYAKENHS